jgi:hypothetical protein
VHVPHLANDHPGLARFFWAACGSVVLLFIFLAALTAIDPLDAIEVTVVVMVLAALFLAHEWRGQWRAEHPRRR